MPAFDLFDINAESGWKKLSSRLDDTGPHVTVEHAQFTTPTRTAPVNWTIVKRKAAVAIAPILEDGRFVLISQERVPVQHTMWEFPAGQVDVAPEAVTHEDVLATALNELREETGCELAEGGTLESAGYYFPSAGFTQEVIYLFIAHPVRTAGKPQPVGNEHIAGIRCVTLEEMSGMIARNEITASVGLAMFAKLCAIKG